MPETDGMAADHAYGDGRTGDAADLGILTQNRHMLRQAVPWFGWLSASDRRCGTPLDTDLCYDVRSLHAAQQC